MIDQPTMCLIAVLGPILALEIGWVVGWLTRSDTMANAIGKEELDVWFKYHAPTILDVPKFEAIRNKARELAETILMNTPPSADQTVAIRLVREAVMVANASIACGGR
jgi:hypothetical protein